MLVKIITYILLNLFLFHWYYADNSYLFLWYCTMVSPNELLYPDQHSSTMHNPSNPFEAYIWAVAPPPLKQWSKKSIVLPNQN